MNTVTFQSKVHKVLPVRPAGRTLAFDLLVFDVVGQGTEEHIVTYFGDDAQAVAEGLQPGDDVIVIGRLRKWTQKSDPSVGGAGYTVLRVYANQIAVSAACVSAHIGQAVLEATRASLNPGAN